ncbi:DUF167 domain-containing protein [Rhodopirellula sp. MGV]|uniref:DUF167 domain-containing protein n=1 Tax=Rhodopirellula sp. MGV TaxID=2023130 RepID=UPI000B968AC2|nr:DUF167 domain-containing protein [Rhodopirellula sp. MGV]OYP37910.1 hypothetical protein CGZ80_04085 [Rhodopirellula sp. MGV]PNY37087.1 DUF167 domain-containing protein [Rhodopirellula baltica]
MIELEVHAKPGAAKNQVGGVHDGRLRVSVTAPADKGKANAAIRKLLGKALSIAPSSIELVSGATSRQKRFQIDVDGEAAERLQSEIGRYLSQ